MNRVLMIIFLALIVNVSRAQKGKDTIVYNLPIVDGKLVYSDSVAVKGRSRIVLDSIAKKWFAGNVTPYKDCCNPLATESGSSVFSQGLLQFRAPPNSWRVVYYDYIMLVTVKVDCGEGYYKYKIYDMHFRPKSNFFNTVVEHPTNPEYLIDRYKKKKYGLLSSMPAEIIRIYLACVNTSVRNCIASLNKAMAN
jgi:hypothetical protein